MEAPILAMESAFLLRITHWFQKEAGLAFFFAAKPPPLCLPHWGHWGRGTAPAVDRVLSYIVDLRRISPLIFHTAPALSGSLRSPPSPRGEGCVSGIAVSPSNLRPFGAPPSIGRRRAPSLGRGCRAQRGGVGFRSRLKRNGKRRFLVSSSRAQPRDLFRFPFPFSFVMLSA